MSALNDIRKNINVIKEEEKIKKNLIKKTISLQNDNYQKEIFKKLNEGTVLNLIKNSNRRKSVKSLVSEYDLCMINKYDENLNSSLSFISEFDLEEDNENDISFNSLENDNSVEQIDIVDINKIKSLDKIEEEEHKTKLEKEWQDIKDILLNKNSS